MAETIKGGAYKGADGKWHDANGKPLPSSKVQEAEELAAKRAKELAEAEAVATKSALPLEPVVVKPATVSRSKGKDKGKG